MGVPLSYRLLSRRSLRFYWRTQLSVVAGVSIAAMVLVGAMLVGDCVRYSLRRFALLRLGRIAYAIDARNRFFDDSLAGLLGQDLDVRVVAVLGLKGVAVHERDTEAETARVNRVRVLGVDPSFWGLGSAATIPLGKHQIALGRKLAAALGAAVGDELAVRVGQPAQMPRDAPLASRKERLSRRHVFRVTAIVGDDALGRFSLDAVQVAPYNAFVDRAWLQASAGLEGRANMLLVGGSGEREIGVGDLRESLARCWRIEHVGLRLRAAESHGFVQLESDRIFLDAHVGRAVLGAGERRVTGGIGVLAYLVNGIACEDGSRRTPYSFVVACGPSDDRDISLVPPGMRDDEIIVNRWLADTLSVGSGAVVRLNYSQLDAGGGFTEAERTFVVRSVVEMDRFRAEREAMPRFPGLTDVETCREWDIGLPIDEALLEDAGNEEYWERYRETPKAIVTFRAGREMWSNRFGSLSAVRFPARTDAETDSIRRRLRETLDPGELGLFFLPVRDQAAAAIEQSLDFGQLFLSMSFFLIVAALMLTALLFVFGVEQRLVELGTLRALGYGVGHVRRLLLMEGWIVAGAGSVAGGLLGTLYTRALIGGLATYWRGAVAGAAIRYHAEPGTLLLGMGISFACGMAAILAALWRHTRRSPRELLAGDATGAQGDVPGSAARRIGLLSAVGLLLAIGVVVAVQGNEQSTVPGFFGAGALLLLSGLGFCRAGIGRMRGGAADRMTLARLGIRNAARRPGRSMTIVGLLACGGFIVFAVSAMREDVRGHAEERWSGTGGFALFGETTLPVPDPLESTKGRSRFRLDRDPLTARMGVVSIKVHDGDDASCFNLNRAQSPRLLGVDPAAMHERSAFERPGGSGGVWNLLMSVRAGHEVPGLVGDSDTAMWGLKKKVGPEAGDVLTYRDERGEMFRVRLVGKLPMRLSVFQGTVLIPVAEFARRFPSESGYRMFLFDRPGADGRAVGSMQRTLSRRMAEVGLDIVPAVGRLEDFYSVEATYLAMFLVLGGLGLLLGSLGVGLVVLRNVLERRHELGILRCVGFSVSEVGRVVMAEHWFLLAAGLLVGVVAAGAAIWPSLREPGGRVPYAALAGLAVTVLAAGFVWIGAASRAAVRGRLMDALRTE